MSDRKNYWQDVEDYAREIIDTEGLNEDAWHDYVSETIGGCHWIIMYADNETVLDESRNEPDDDEVREMTEGGWRSMRQVAAQIAMERDVLEKLKKIKDEYYKCDYCGETFQGEPHDHEQHGLVCPRCFVEQTIEYNVEIDEHHKVAKTAKELLDSDALPPLIDFLSEHDPFKDDDKLFAAVAELAAAAK
jgi:hypothetical protein